MAECYVVGITLIKGGADAEMNAYPTVPEDEVETAALKLMQDGSHVVVVFRAPVTRDQILKHLQTGAPVQSMAGVVRAFVGATGGGDNGV